MEQLTGQNWERNMTWLYIVPLLIQLLCRVHHVKCWAGESQAGIKISGRNIKNLRYTDDATLMAESEEELKSLLMNIKEESGKGWLKTQHSKKLRLWHPVSSLYGK